MCYVGSTNLFYTGWVSTWMGDCLQAGEPSQYVISHLGQLCLLSSVEW